MTLAVRTTLAHGSAPVERPSLDAAEVSTGALGRSFDACKEITRTRARNFYHGLRLTPEPKRSALYAVYAWMREADDIADGEENGETRAARLERFAARTRAVMAGEHADVGDEWWSAFGVTCRAFALDAAPFERTIDGVREDIEGAHVAGDVTTIYEDRAALEAYCERVASTVGVLCLRIWGVRAPGDWPEAHRLAIERGVAFQLTNILRDIREDAGEGRCYLPADLLAAHGIDAPALCAWDDPESCASVIGEVASWARGLYASSARLDELVHADGRAPMWAMTWIYRGLLDRVEADPERAVVGARVRLPGAVKVGIALRAAWRARRAG